MMTRPVVGIIGNFYFLDDNYPVHSTGTMNTEAISQVANAIPLIIPSDPRHFSSEELMESCDGFLFTGGKPNVHPEEYGEEPTPAHGHFDRNRDRVTLPLIRACEKRGQPILGVCRGFQEFNVAFGGTLHPEIRDLPGIMNHRMPPQGTLDEKFALRHTVDFVEGSVFEKIMNAKNVRVNSLHGQGIKVAGPRVVIEGYAPDGTPEALSVKASTGFTLAVQWHPEYNATNDPVSVGLFKAFGKALLEWQKFKQNSPKRMVA